MRKIGLTMRVDVSAHGEKRNALDMQWPELLMKLSFVPVLLPNTGAGAENMIEAHDLSALILTGGNDTVETGASFDRTRQDFEMTLLRAAQEKKMPVIGICRGMQMINLFFQGSNQNLSGHVSNDHPVEWNGETFSVNSYHDYGIPPASLGKDLQVEAVAPDGTIEAVRHVSLPWFGVMWHPERSIPNANKHHDWLAQILSGGKK